jgi:ankyrin repeat protein
VILDFFHQQQPHEIKKILNQRDAKNGTGLMIAAYYNHYDLVEVLIKQGVDIDVKDYVRSCLNPLLSLVLVSSLLDPLHFLENENSV